MCVDKGKNMDGKPSVSITRRPLYYWIFRYCRTLQLLLFGVILITMFFRVLPLEMQKRIVNEAIDKQDINLLIIYSATYLGAVVIAGLSKYLINMLQVIIGQRMLVELRNNLFAHVLHLPLQRFRGLRPASAVSALVGELNSIGTFLGEAIAVPFTALLTYVVVLGYMFSLSPKLTLLTMAVYPFELVAIPLLQRKFNHWNRKRVETVRSMSDTINEAINGVVEIKSYNRHELEGKRLSGLIGIFYRILITLNLYKFGIKFTGNLFQSLGPFLLFFFGGFLAIKGHFSLGALVAFLSAHEKLYDPWQEMRLFYQEYQNAVVLYRQITRLFDQSYQPLEISATDADAALACAIQADSKPPLISLCKVDYRLPGNINLLRDINLSIDRGEHIALVGPSGCGKSTLAMVLAGLYPPSKGKIELNGRMLSNEPQSKWSITIAMVPQRPFIFSGTLRENILYGLLPPDGDPAPIFQDVRPRLYHLLKRIGLEKDVVWLGMSSIPSREKAQLLREQVLRMRQLVHHELSEQFEKVVEFYDRERFLHYATLRDNLIFGESPNGEYQPDKLPANGDFQELMAATGLARELLELGLALARISLDMIQQIGIREELLEIMPMQREELTVYGNIIGKLDEGHKLHGEDKNRLLTLALRYIPAKHNLVRLKPDFMDRILQARHHFLQKIKKVEHCPGHRDSSGNSMATREDDVRDFNDYCYSTYLYKKNIRTNILFGSPKKTFDDILQLKDLAWETFREHNLLDDIIDLGLDFEVGSQGSHLSGGQRQKVSIGRALLSNAELLVLDEATASLDNLSQALVQDYISKELTETAVVSIIHRLDLAVNYDRIVVMAGGTVVEDGSFADLMSTGGVFQQLYQSVNNQQSMQKEKTQTTGQPKST
jgi:ABC-type multidrug transport system fused ATPase/permease subunit